MRPPAATAFALTSATAPSSSGPAGVASRRPQLDGLRGLAVLGVLIQHGFPRIGHLVPWAHASVRLFFVLSGFLITGILLRARDRVDAAGRGRRLELAQFHARRVARVFPAYFLVILVGVAFGVGPIRDAWPWLATFSSNLFIARRGEWVDGYFHFWTLAIEAQFYVAWSLFLLLAPRRWFVPAAGAMLVCGPLYRVLAVGLGLGPIAVFCATPACLDTLAAGALVAMLTGGGVSSGPGWEAGARWACLTGWLAVVALRVLRLSGLGWPEDVGLDSALALGCGGLVFLATRGFRGAFGRCLGSSVLGSVGVVSYGLYIYHVFVPALVLALLPRVCATLGVADPVPSPAIFGGILVGVVSVTVLSWYLVERPVQRLAARLLGRRRADRVGDGAPVPPRRPSSAGDPSLSFLSVSS